MPGAEYAAHCYCGHQFGQFAGQLGDGATMYVGSVSKNKEVLDFQNLKSLENLRFDQFFFSSYRIRQMKISNRLRGNC